MRCSNGGREFFQQQIKLLQRLQRSQEAWEILRQQTILDDVTLLKLKATLLLSEQRYQEALHF